MIQNLTGRVRMVPDSQHLSLFQRLTSTGWFMAIASPLLMLLAWEVLVRSGLMDSRFFPPPTAVITELAAMLISGELLTHIGYTLGRVVVGFTLGAVPAVLLGIVMGLSPVIRMFLRPALASIYPIPKVALFPLAMLIFGLGEPSKWAIIALAVFFQVLFSTLAGVVNIDRIYLDVAANFRASRWQAYRTIALPAALPYIFTGFQLGLGMSLIVVVIVENFGTNFGLGYVIWRSWQVFEVTDMYVALVVIALLGFLSQMLVIQLERVFIPWKRTPKKPVQSSL